MNLAVVLSVSEYINGDNLPACKNDGSFIKEILESTGKYSEVLFLNESRDASVEKESLISFIEKYKGSSIDEVFFYFSGHGYFDGSEFYYLLADYDTAKQKQTSLENSELDDFLRSLDPKLTIKIIDACHSGIGYIKDRDSLSEYIKGMGQKFSHCYFMYSSQADQLSYADQNISYFTREFGMSLIARKSQEIRYKDITDYVSDAFQNVSRQRPYFVSQATNTEIFFSNTEDFNRTIKTLLDKFGISTALAPIGAAVGGSLVDRISQDSARYCKYDEAIEIIEKLKSDLQKQELKNPITELFEVEWSERGDYRNISDFKTVGDWIKDNKEDFFAEYTTTTKKIEYDRTPFGINVAGINRLLGTDTVTVVTGAYSTVDLPFKQLVLSATPKFPNITKTSLIVLPFLSQTTLLVFYCFIEYSQTGWGEAYRPHITRWHTKQAPLKNRDEVTTLCANLLDSFVDFTIKPLIEEFDTVEGEIVEIAAQPESAESAS